MQRLGEQRGQEAVGERHAGGARAEGVGEQVQPALHDAGGELRFAVLPVVERGDGGRGDYGECGVASEALVAADPLKLLA